ncbi:MULTISPECIES: helix-turn-helix domain-containing protein [Thalassospira]|jgi:AraC family transcriptional activator of pobA|uniref:Transcriptional regulator n=2 Tax=Thalassospira TaxID=168934 RepID=A0ABR5Y3K1_9PROT|nr:MULTISPECIES: helix-turn-helix domain-containing protein [Thalassospira]MAL28432.1 AraC family transcriptional regulator [Thalassospira sp.]MBR9782166.1 helix-turn-helix domain-containing protein [Rhodospirillales bacterium]KZD04922.1 transcriptional regulator [Thalassospira xiamenensis]KZD11614.1 transcriptional regulator [Thalassospira xiamenensis]MBL4841843.1 helix-turn-helix domain-containing protein [Thalassospira sp.]|tara:strand:+ start:1089 stop:2009 length:921 start_codon:yes stop_codon:yes gene_type:complete
MIMVATRNSIPVYKLYGETGDTVPGTAEQIAISEPEFFHLESIPSRSKLHDLHIQPHRHANLFQLLYITHGHAGIEFDDRQFTMQVGHLLTLPPGTVHGFRFSPDIDGWVISLTDYHLQEILAPAPKLLARLDRPLCVDASATADQPSPTDFLIRQLVAEYFGHNTGRLYALRNILGLLLLGIGRDAPSGDPARLSRKEQKTAKFRKFQSLIETFYKQHKPLEFYAREIGITTTQLNRIAKDIYGMTAIEVLHHRLILEAKRTLIYTDIAVQQIADELGFRDAGYFSRFFAKKAAMSPVQFRQDHR